jgi:hypothetical protein|tara:strand:+ start:1637 stop:2743 length:1107 start_codon:yes stop_codon:yes gene_type:complete
MAGYKFGKNAVFGSGNTTDNLVGPNLIVGNTNIVSGSAVNSLVVGTGNTIKEDAVNVSILGGKNHTINPNSEECAIIGGSGNTIESTSGSPSDASVILGGALNKVKASSDGMIVVGGLLGNASSTTGADDSVILGGTANSLDAGISDAIVGGTLNIGNGSFSDGIIIGSGNNFGSQNSSCFGDGNTLVNTNYRMFLGGSHFGAGSTTGDYAVMSGYYPYSNIALNRVHGGGKFGSVTGSAQFLDTIVGCQTTDGTETTMVNQIAGSGTSIPIRQDSSMLMKIHIVARRTGTQTESAAYEILGCIKNDNGTTALQGSITKTVIAEADAAWDVTAVANNTDDTLDIKVTGAAAKNINWVAKVTLVETNGA